MAGLWDRWRSPVLAPMLSDRRLSGAFALLSVVQVGAGLLHLHTFTCLKALAAEAERVAIEVIVMDDNAPVAASEALRGVTGVRFERNPRNLGFVGNCNRGATLARGEFLLMLNNDAVPEAGCIEALIDVFARFPRAGAAGAKLVYPDGRLQEAGAIVWRDGWPRIENNGPSAERGKAPRVR